MPTLSIGVHWVVTYGMWVAESWGIAPSGKTETTYNPNPRYIDALFQQLVKSQYLPTAFTQRAG